MKKFVFVILSIFMLNSSIQAKLNTGNYVGAVMALSAIVALSQASDECRYESFKNYETNKLMITNPGTTMIDFKTNVCKQDKLRLAKTIESVSGKYKIVVDKSDTVINKNTSFNYVVAETIIRATDMISGVKPKKLNIKIDKDGKLLSFDSELTSLKKDDIGSIYFEPIVIMNLTKDTFSQEIIYSGRVGDELYLTYREYNSNLIKAPFTQKVVFDLSKGSTVTVKNYHFEIIEADNNKIVYKVIE